MELCVYYLKSPLTYNKDLDAQNRAFIAQIEQEIGFSLPMRDFSEMTEQDFPLVFVATGGTEGIYLSSPAAGDTAFLLTSGKNNSLAASMEILSYMNLNGKRGEIIHGSAEEIACRIRQLATIFRAKKRLQGIRIGAIGAPSDWLIASGVDYEKLRDRTGLCGIDIPFLRSSPRQGSSNIPKTISPVHCSPPGMTSRSCSRPSISMARSSASANDMTFVQLPCAALTS